MARKFCAVDAEGDAGERGLLGVAFYSDERQVWHTDPAVIRAELLWHAKRGYTFVAHNMEYDLSVIWWQLGLPAVSISYNREFNHGEWKYEAKRAPAHLWDSLNLAGGIALGALGAAIGCPKYDSPQILAGIDPNRWRWICERHGRGECLECYAIRDAEIVWRYITEFQLLVATWGATLQRKAGSTGAGVWRTLDRPAPLRLRNRQAAYLGRKSYYGGRVECFKLGHFAPLYCADVTSMYPSVMAETPFPDPRSTVTLSNIAPGDIPWDAEGAAEVTVHVPHSLIPPLPNTHNGERIFATGTQRGYWTLLELRYAVSLGAEVQRVHRIAFTRDLLYPFTLFVGTLWALREEYMKHRDPRAIAVKAMLNETYGRFGLAVELAEERIQVLAPGARHSDHLGCRHFGAYGQYMCGKVEQRWFDRSWQNELWAAQITAAARVKLHRYLMLQGDNVVYCDTDSVFSTASIVGLGTGIGALSKETVYERSWIVGPKMYRMEPYEGEALSVAKGIPRELAADFLAGRQVYFDRPLSPHQMLEGRGQAGAWHTISRERRLVPYRRQPVDPLALEREGSWTATLPPVFGPG